MKKTLLATTLATITLISASSAFAADTVDLNVGGTIAATACTPALSGGGTIDFGDIKTDILNQDSYTALPKKLIDITITCDGMTKLAIFAVDNRPGTVGEGASRKVSGNEPFSPNVSDGTNAKVVGLGMDGQNKIGSYFMTFDTSTVTADGNSLNLMYYDDQTGQWWNSAPFNQIFYKPFAAKNYLSWGKAGTPGIPLQVLPFKTMTSKISVQAYIAKASSLDLTKPLKLDGSTTIEIEYL